MYTCVWQNHHQLHTLRKQSQISRSPTSLPTIHLLWPSNAHTLAPTCPWPQSLPVKLRIELYNKCALSAYVLTTTPDWLLQIIAKIYSKRIHLGRMNAEEHAKSMMTSRWNVRTCSTSNLRSLAISWSCNSLTVSNRDPLPLSVCINNICHPHRQTPINFTHFHRDTQWVCEANWVLGIP